MCIGISDLLDFFDSKNVLMNYNAKKIAYKDCINNIAKIRLFHSNS